jgi:nicotinate phosphoribosyltransferase
MLLPVVYNLTRMPELAFDKAKAMLKAGCSVSEFGTRRRRSFRTQDLVVQAFDRAAKESAGLFNGTSNVRSEVNDSVD